MRSLFKRCVQDVYQLCRKSLGAGQKNRSLWTRPYLYAVNTLPVTRSIHKLINTSTAVKTRIVHTIHTPYKEQKKIKFNLLLISPVENAK